ncbi:MAG: hypothetical protein FWE75_23795 [Actinomycetia bacterium]|nr:hypothetical protein [Actinomycetes bacterium]
MTTATQSSRRPAKRAAKSTAKSPKGAAARGRSSTTTRSTKGKAKASSGGGRGGQGRAKTESRTKAGDGAKSGGRAKAGDRAKSHAQGHEHDMTITIPVDSAANAVGKVVTLPVTAAQRILPAAGGLPLYVGLGALGIVGVLEWPVAAGIGVGYAVLRQGGPLNPHPDKDAVK